MATAVGDAPPDESWAGELQDRIAGVCGQINALHGELVGLIGEVIDSKAWQQWGIGSLEQHVCWEGRPCLRARRASWPGCLRTSGNTQRVGAAPGREDAFGYFDEHGHYHLAVHAGNDVGVVIGAARSPSVRWTP